MSRQELVLKETYLIGKDSVLSVINVMIGKNSELVKSSMGGRNV